MVENLFFVLNKFYVFGLDCYNNVVISEEFFLYFVFEVYINVCYFLFWFVKVFVYDVWFMFIYIIYIYFLKFLY